MCGGDSSVNTVIKDQLNLLKVLASGQQQSSHRNYYNHSFIPVRITPYIEDTEKTGMTTQSTSLMNMNSMMKMYFILYPKIET